MFKDLSTKPGKDILANRHMLIPFCKPHLNMFYVFPIFVSCCRCFFCFFLWSSSPWIFFSRVQGWEVHCRSVSRQEYFLIRTCTTDGNDGKRVSITSDIVLNLSQCIQIYCKIFSQHCRLIFSAPESSAKELISSASQVPSLGGWLSCNGLKSTIT